MERGDIILAECRDHLGGESNVIYKCAPDEAQRLKDVNELPGYIKCFDGEQRICRIRRKRKRAVIPRIRPGHIVLVKLRDREDCEGIVLLKYKPDEAQQLVENLGKLGIKAGNSEERQTSSNMTSDDNKEEMKGEKGGGEEAGVGAGNEPKTQSENSEEEQIGNVMPFGGNSESEEKSGETAAVGSGSAKKKQSTTSVDSSMEDKCLLEKKSAMNILLECDEEKAEASTPESSTATTSKKISSLNEDIMEYLLENQSRRNIDKTQIAYGYIWCLPAQCKR
uniref:S1 domain containing protein n=1 Tax=Haemonchus contortus TaxID=6289 RepID=W6NFZ0_HAECO